LAGERIDKISDGETKESILEHLKKALGTAISKAVPGVSIVKRDLLRCGRGSLELDGGIIFSAKELSSHMTGAVEICAFLATIGSGIEEEASSDMKFGDHLGGYLLDRIGSFAVESLAKNTEDGLRRSLISRDLSVSMRFSPGYCDWPIEDQFKLAKIIDFAGIGVTLTENCMMIPKKSITAIVGVGPKELFSKILSPCAACNMKVCGYRRIGY
ncbi:MAG: vitamin B12 dependent-methionine synthase activation domain-containing protein, partial [Candidatus Omnitrophota bacterium]|nr:vitamin B12 dependent-methionine synthase activation domain-containing protein [Candidatus Omnitrophota bacterium]